MLEGDVSTHLQFATPLKKRRRKGSFKYSTRKALERSRMGKNLTRITECNISATTRTLSFEKIVEDTEQPEIYKEDNVEIISDTRLDIQDTEEEVESQNTMEVRY